MVKRKAEEPLQDHDWTNRRRTRSSGLLSETQPSLPPMKRSRKALPVVSSSSTGSFNSNDANYSTNETSDDELNFLGASPGKADAGSASPRHLTPAVRRGPGTPRHIMDGVVITTPKSIFSTPRKYLGHVADSPSPSRPRNIGKASPKGPPSGSRKYITSQSPRKPPVFLPVSSPSRSLSPPPPKCTLASPVRPTATKRPPRPLPSNLIPHLHSQKKAVLHALQHPPLTEYEASPYPLAFSQLTELVNGTVRRHEGNSCLILGPRGSGKNRLLDQVLTSVAPTSSHTPVIIRLSSHCQTNDRLAMREIARQIQQQQGSSLLPTVDDEEDSIDNDSTRVSMDLPPSSQLPGVVAALPGLGRPVIVVLDGFDGFAAHARQALLYCLLDTVQSCRGGSAPVKLDNESVDPPTNVADQEIVEENSSTEESSAAATARDGDEEVVTTGGEHGLLVIGITSRVDCVTLLEKRVKSRFSHRLMRVGTPSRLDDFVEFLKAVLHVEVRSKSATAQEWNQLWTASVKEFLADNDMLNALKETFAFGKDLRVLFRLLTSPVAALTPDSPWLTASRLISSVSTQRSRTRFPFLNALPYPHVALLIAAAHTQTAGHDTFNFEVLHDKFATQVRVSVCAPVQLERGGLGMVNVAQGVLLGAFEQLVANRVFQPIAAASTHITKEFVKYRCMATREDLKGAVEHLGQTNLKKWFSRNQ